MCNWAIHLFLGLTLSYFPLAYTYNKCIYVNLFSPSLHVTYQLLSQVIFQLTLNPLTWKIRWAPNIVSRRKMGFKSAFKGLIKLYWNFLLCRTMAMNAAANIVYSLFFLKTMCFKPNCSYSVELFANNRITCLFRNTALSYVLFTSSTVPVFSVQLLEIWQSYFHHSSSLHGKQPSTLTCSLV